MTTTLIETPAPDPIADAIAALTAAARRAGRGAKARACGTDGEGRDALSRRGLARSQAGAQNATGRAACSLAQRESTSKKSSPVRVSRQRPSTYL